MPGKRSASVTAGPAPNTTIPTTTMRHSHSVARHPIGIGIGIGIGKQPQSTHRREHARDGQQAHVRAHRRDRGAFVLPPPHARRPKVYARDGEHHRERRDEGPRRVAAREQPSAEEEPIPGRVQLPLAHGLPRLAVDDGHGA